MPKFIDFQAISVFKNNIMDLINQKLSPNQNNAYKILFSSDVPQNVNPGEIVMVYENANGTNKKISSIWISGDDIEEPEPIIEEPGLYDADGVMLASWDELVNDYGLEVTKEYNASTCKTYISGGKNAMAAIINTYFNNSQKLIMGNAAKIGDYAFYDCNTLKSIKIPEGTSQIYYNAFENCISLLNIELPSSITWLGTKAFKNCSKLTGIILQGVKSIGDNVFENCTSLVDLELASQAEVIGAYAFKGCTQLKTIYIPNTVTTIGNWAFYECTDLKIYTGSSSKKSGWNTYYNEYYNKKTVPVIFNITYEEYESTYKQ